MKRDSLSQFYTTDTIIEEIINSALHDVTPGCYFDCSAGFGYFGCVLESRGWSGVSIDVEPKHPRVLEQDLFQYKKGPGNVDLCGFNPPYGYKGNDAMRFVKQCVKLMHPTYLLLLVPGSLIRRVETLGYECTWHNTIEKNAFTTKQGDTFNYPAVAMLFKRRTHAPAQRTTNSDNIHVQTGIVHIPTTCNLIVRRVGANHLRHVIWHDGIAWHGPQSIIDQHLNNTLSRNSFVYCTVPCICTDTLCTFIMQYPKELYSDLNQPPSTRIRYIRDMLNLFYKVVI